MPTSYNRATIVNGLRQAMSGLKKHFGSAPTLLIEGKAMKPDDVIAQLQGAIDAIDASIAAEAAFHAQVDAQRAAIATARVLVRGLKGTVRTQLGTSLAVQTDFGFVEKTPKVLTPEEKAAAVAKGKATRAARGTKGPRQKAKIKGSVAAGAASATKPA